MLGALCLAVSNGFGQPYLYYFMYLGEASARAGRSSAETCQLAPKSGPVSILESHSATRVLDA